MERRLRRFVAGGLTKSFGAETKSGPVVDTSAGKIRGLVIDKVNAFKGIPYGASTAGERRFLPPVKPEGWTGIRDTLAWGPEAPQVSPHTEIPEVRATIPATGMSEDCLRLNVWSASFGRTDKRSGNGLAARRRIRQRQRQLYDL